MTAIRIVAAFTLREALRRRIFLVVSLLTIAFGILYSLGTWQAFRFLDEFGTPVPGVEPRVAVGATILGLGMFSILFLGCVLAVFLTLGVVRGDAERGLVQPLLVRPVTRTELLIGRGVAAAGVAAGYVVVVYAVAVVVTGVIGEWWPDRIVVPGLALALGVVVIAALSVAGSVVLPNVANGIAVFMLFGAGLILGLLGQIGHFSNSATLEDIARWGGYVLPFEGLYRVSLDALTADTFGITRLVVNLSILGGGQAAGLGLWAWSLTYVVVVMAGAAWAFNRRDL
jgi:ABC-type transport system involved in multi-copper enzyme maturation permease subunit